MPSLGGVASVYGAIALIAASPLLGAWAAGRVAEKFGGRLSDAGAGPCVVAGWNIGPLLHGFFVLGWLAIVTVPGGILAALGYTAYLVFRWLNG